MAGFLGETKRLVSAGTQLRRAVLDPVLAADFDRVLVFDDGKLAEDGAPQDLLATPDSIYARLFARDEAVQHTVWGDHSFKRMRVENTTLHTSGSLP